MSRLPLVALVLLSGCAPHTDSANGSVDIGQAATAAQGAVHAYGQNVAADRPAATPRAPLPEPTPRAPGTPGALPDDRTPISEAPFAPDSAQGAADVVQTYYASIAEGRYARARALWEPGAAGAGASDAAFAAGFARYASYRALVGAPGAIEAGAGQRYVTVPVQVTARGENGAAVFEIGSATLHRVADIDGATADQRRWRVRSIDLRPAPAATATPSASVTRYRCIDGSRLTVAFDPARATATVRSDGKVEVLLAAPRPAAPGIRYAGGGSVLRADGERVTYQRPSSPPLACATR